MIFTYALKKHTKAACVIAHIILSHTGIQDIWGGTWGLGGAVSASERPVALLSPGLSDYAETWIVVIMDNTINRYFVPGESLCISTDQWLKWYGSMIYMILFDYQYDISQWLMWYWSLYTDTTASKQQPNSFKTAEGNLTRGTGLWRMWIKDTPTDTLPLIPLPPLHFYK